MSGDASASAGSESREETFLPPATTREPLRERPVDVEDSRPIEPFYPRGEADSEPTGQRNGSPDAEGEPATEPEPAPTTGVGELPLIELTDVVPEDGGSADAEPTEPAAEGSALSTPELAEGSRAFAPHEPAAEESGITNREVPGADAAAGSQGSYEHAAVLALASRLEFLAERLRSEGASALGPGLHGDRLDTLLSGLLAGYLAND